MSISTLDYVLVELKDELENKIDGNSPYYTILSKVVRGAVLWTDIENHMPAVWFTVTDETVDETFGTKSIGTIDLEIHGIINNKGNTDNIHKLLKDIKYFLYNDYTKTDDLTIVNYAIKEGGVMDMIDLGEFVVIAQLNYSYDTITL